MPNGRCKMHGGLTPNGIAKNLTAGGRYSKYLPARLTERFEAAVNDPNLLHLNSEIALSDARLTELLEQVSNGESGELWRKLKEQKQLYTRARDNEKPEALAELFFLIDEGFQDFRGWQEIRTTVDHRRKLVDSQVANLHKDSLSVAESAAFTLRLAQGFKGIVDRFVLQEQRQAAYVAVMGEVTAILQKREGKG